MILSPHSRNEKIPDERHGLDTRDPNSQRCELSFAQRVPSTTVVSTCGDSIAAMMGAIA
jgi:hypothetical protein